MYKERVNRMMEVNIMPDMGMLIAQGISTVLLIAILGVSIYAIILTIKALKIYIKKNS